MIFGNFAVHWIHPFLFVGKVLWLPCTFIIASGGALVKRDLSISTICKKCEQKTWDICTKTGKLGAPHPYFAR